MSIHHRRHHPRVYNLRTGSRLLYARIRALLTHPMFGFLTVVGNLFIAFAAFCFYQLEFGINPHLKEPIDALWWAMATITTVGYGDVYPITFYGKVFGMGVMIIGSALFWSYTALFAAVLMEPDPYSETQP